MSNHALCFSYDAFSITPKKGQYAVYPQKMGHLINSSILPIPTSKGKGEIIFKTGKLLSHTYGFYNEKNELKTVHKLFPNL